ncbi:MAG: hypothetical protein FWE33_01740 [Defluviitaleaceae bacterium]|nr:hypothetical protein [Defluviitaleaceae bacterium]
MMLKNWGKLPYPKFLQNWDFGIFLSGEEVWRGWCYFGECVNVKRENDGVLQDVTAIATTDCEKVLRVARCCDLQDLEFLCNDIRYDVVEMKVVNNPDGSFNHICFGLKNALVAAAQAIRQDLVNNGTMPFDTGHLQNAATYVDVGGLDDEKVSIVNDTVYARRKYFHPEFSFNQTINNNAGARWFDPYINNGLAQKTFAEVMKNELKRG